MYCIGGDWIEGYLRGYDRIGLESIQLKMIGLENIELIVREGFKKKLEFSILGLTPSSQATPDGKGGEKNLFSHFYDNMCIKLEFFISGLTEAFPNL